jgi:hypothetical protein
MTPGRATASKESQKTNATFVCDTKALGVSLLELRKRRRTSSRQV